MNAHVASDTYVPLVVREIADETPLIRTYELVREDGGAVEPFEAGAHLLVKLPGGLIRSYSLCNPPSERHRYVIAVKREDAGRGGSKAMFHDVKAGDRLLVSHPRNLFRLAADASATILIAGGIGITPILAMAHALQERGADFRLYYCTRSRPDTAFRQLVENFDSRGNVVIHHDEGDPAKGLALRPLLEAWQEGLHLYCCGPRGLMQAVKAATSHWPAGSVHFEDFEPAPVDVEGNHEFTVTLASSGLTYVVPPDKSILQVLQENGLDLPSSCEAGTCSTCMTGLISGEAEHRDHVLMEDEQQSNIMICVSRAAGENLVLDL